MNRPTKPNPNLRKTEENKPKKTVDVYHDKTDNSVNVPIAGIKKHYYEPNKLPSNFPKKEIKPKPKPTVKSGSNIMTLSSLNQIQQEEKVMKPKRMDNGRRDILGMLQDQATDDVLPCMRKNKK